LTTYDWISTDLMNDGKIDRKLFEQKLVSTALPKYLKFMSSNCLCCFDKNLQTFYFFKVSESIDDEIYNNLKSLHLAFPTYGSTKQDQADSNIKIG
jgi:hypothetical protein